MEQDNAVVFDAEIAEWNRMVGLQFAKLAVQQSTSGDVWSDTRVMEELLALRLAEPQGDPDSLVTPPTIPVTQLGDTWLLGVHRLRCGDSTSREDVKQLFAGAKPFMVVTDPPYGVEYNPEWRDGVDLGIGERSRGKVAGDNRVDWSDAFRISQADVMYVWHASLYTSASHASLLRAGYVPRAQLIWVKQHFQISQGAYHWQHEPVWYAVKDGATARWTGDRKQTSIWNISNNNAFGGAGEDKFGHGTQKPVECMARPIRNHGKAGDVIYDPFVGVGTTIIACEQLGRRCLAMEIDPVYVDACCERWFKYTGQDAIKESDGAEWSSLREKVE